MLIASVLRRSSEYGPEQAHWLHRQIRGYDSVCLTDAGRMPGINTAPLSSTWIGWWAKMELFNPRGPLGSEDILYLDLDSVVVGDLAPLMAAERFTMLTDFYREHMPDAPPGSGVMLIPAAIKSVIWQAWIADPIGHMARFIRPGALGDQGFLASVVANIDRWQDIQPGACVSWKRDVAREGWPGYHDRRSKGDGTIPAGTRVICFHGHPRPWDIEPQYRSWDFEAAMTA